MSTFLKQYSVFIETRVTETDLWNLKNAPFEPLRAYINKFREIKAKISHPNEVVALAALKMASGSRPNSEKKWQYKHVGVENGYDEVNVQIPEEENEKPSSTNIFSK